MPVVLTTLEAEVGRLWSTSRQAKLAQ
jgi:hypothetical protein